MASPLSGHRSLRSSTFTSDVTARSWSIELTLHGYPRSPAGWHPKVRSRVIQMVSISSACANQKSNFSRTVAPDRPIDQSDEEMPQIRLRPQLVEVIESLGKEPGPDSRFTLHSQAREREHDQIEGGVCHDDEVGIDNRRENTAVNQKVARM